MGVRVDLVRVDAKDRLIVADIAMSSGSFRVVASYAPNDQGGVSTFSRQLGPLLVDSSRLV